PHRAVLDPIDGTAAFVAGLATWCVCIGILEDARPVAGVVHLPCLGETYSAVGGAAWLNGAPLASLGAAGPVGDRFIVAHAHAHRRHRITYPGKARSLGSTAYHIAPVPRGAADGPPGRPPPPRALARPRAIPAAAGRGLNVIVHYNASAAAAAATVREMEALGVRGLAIGGGLARGEDVARLAREAEARSGGVDVLVNNASKYLHAPFDELTEAIWD